MCLINGAARPASRHPRVTRARQRQPLPARQRQPPPTRQSVAASGPSAPAPAATHAPASSHVRIERASASRHPRTSHRPHPDRARKRQRRPSRGGDHGGHRDGKAHKKCRSIPAIRSQITRPLPTNSPPLAPQTDTTSAVFSAWYKLEGGGHRQRDAAAQNWKHFLLLYRRRFCELC